MKRKFGSVSRDAWLLSVIKWRQVKWSLTFTSSIMGDNLRFNFASKLWLATHDIICEEARRYEYEINVKSKLLGKYEIMIVFGGQVSLIAQVTGKCNTQTKSWFDSNYVITIFKTRQPRFQGLTALWSELASGRGKMRENTTVFRCSICSVY